jgi:hypothetical protein
VIHISDGHGPFINPNGFTEDQLKINNLKDNIKNIHGGLLHTYEELRKIGYAKYDPLFANYLTNREHINIDIKNMTDQYIDRTQTLINLLYDFYHKIYMAETSGEYISMIYQNIEETHLEMRAIGIKIRIIEMENSFLEYKRKLEREEKRQKHILELRKRYNDNPQNENSEYGMSDPEHTRPQDFPE